MGCDCGKPKCDGHCGVSPAVLQINNPSECVLFRKVEVPASMGTSVENPPKPGAYRNVLLYYKADGEAYLYSSDGMPTKVTGTTSDYEILTNKPRINGVELVGDKSLADIGVTDAISTALEGYTPTSGFAEVAFTGDYEDLVNTPPKVVTHFYTLSLDRYDVGDEVPIYNDKDMTDQTTYEQFVDAAMKGPVQFNQEYDVDAYNISGIYLITADIEYDIGFSVADTPGGSMRTEMLWNKGDSMPVIEYIRLDYTQVNSDWNVTNTSSPAYIKNKPTLATVATSGSYDDLTDKPTIPTVNNATLTVTQNGTSAGTFTANASSDTTINLTDTTYSDFSGATSSVAGASGLVPAPTAGDEDKALKGDGTWSVVGDVVELFINMSPDSLSTPFEIYKSGGYGAPPITHSEMRELFTPSNKKIVVLHETTSYDGVYPVIGFCYDTTEFYIFDGAYSSTYYITSAPGGGDTDFSITRTSLQEKLTAGSNITISGNTISASVGLVEMSYGESNAWAKFIAAYQSHKIVYCRASSSSNPATGSQTRKAFMAFVNVADNPTEVEFQYVRSVGTKTSSQPVDQIFVYKLTSANGGTWTVETRDVAPKLAAGTNAAVSYSNGTYTISATVPTPTVLNMTYDTTATTWTNTDVGITLQETPYGTFPDVRERIQTFAVPTPVFTNASTGSILDAEGLYNLLETGADVVLNGVPVGVRHKWINGTTTFTVGDIVCDGVRLTKVGPFHIEYTDPDTSELVYSMDLSSYSATVSANAAGTTTPTLLPFAIRVCKRVTFDSEVSPDPQTEYAFEIQGTSYSYTDSPT